MNKFCPDCGQPVYTSTDEEGPVRTCTNGHRERPDPNKDMPPAIARARDEILAKVRRATGELEGDIADAIALEASGEAKVLTPDVIEQIPVGQGINVADLLDGDDDPMQVAVEVKAGKSKRGWRYLRDALAQIAGEVNNGGLPGYKGHLTQEQVAHAFPDPVTHWIGARETAPGVFQFRGVIDKAAGELKRWIKTKRITQVSIFGIPKKRTVAGEVQVYGYEPISIDWTPLKRAGMATAIVGIKGEIDSITEPGTESTSTGGGSDTMELTEMFGEMRKAKVDAKTVVLELGLPAGELIAATGAKLEEVGPALDKDAWAKLDTEAKAFGEVAALFENEKDPTKIVASVKSAVEAHRSGTTDEHGKLVDKVIGAKVAGETAQAMVKDMLHLDGDEDEAAIEKVVGEILERPHVKASLKSALSKRTGTPTGGAATGTNKDNKATGEQSGGTENDDRKPALAGVRTTRSRI